MDYYNTHAFDFLIYWLWGAVSFLIGLVGLEVVENTIEIEGVLREI